MDVCQFTLAPFGVYNSTWPAAHIITPLALAMMFSDWKCVLLIAYIWEGLEVTALDVFR